MNCLNCNAPLEHGEHYCWNCGQKNDDGRVTVGTLIRELISSVFNIDAKVFRTVAKLFVPGELTLEYFAGRRTRYFTPLRIFLVSGIIFFAVLSFVLSNVLEKLQKDQETSFDKKVFKNLFLAEIDTAKQQVLESFDNAPLPRAVMDTFSLYFPYKEPDSITFQTSYLSRNFTFERAKMRVSYADFLEKGMDKIAEEQGMEHWMEKKQLKQVFRLMNDASSLLRFILGKLVWMALLMMPALALVLKLLYARRKRYFVEHLFFSFHYHAFAFVIFSLLIAFPDWRMQGAFIAGGLTMLYLYVAMWRYYGQGWFKTFLKFCFLNFTYLFIFVGSLAVTIIAGIFLF